MMMTKQDLFDLYSSDPDLYEKWHIKAGQGLEVCVEDTWKVISDNELYLFDFGYFSIDRDIDIVPRLGGFFIKPEFRNAEGKQRFKQELYKVMPNIFACALYNKNVRGIKFLEKFPGVSIITTTDNYTYFMFRRENT